MLSLELLLAALLVATLLFGFKLERKLRALRDNQAGFIKALSELDGAAARTENGLEMLRQATDEARGALVPRIEAAQSAATRLEQLTSEAELAAKRAESAAESVQASARALAGVMPSARAPRPEPVRAPAPEAPPRLRTPDFAAMLAPTTTRQPLPTTPEPRPQVRDGAASSRLREAAALLRGG
jgi:hypothetical protein